MSEQGETENNKYSHIIVDKGKRAFIFTLNIIVFMMFTSLLFENMIRERHWITVAIPVCLIGSLFILIPRAESWVYEPWQSRHQKYERHFKDNQ